MPTRTSGSAPTASSACPHRSPIRCGRRPGTSSTRPRSRAGFDPVDDGVDRALEPQSLSDADIHRAVAATVRDVLLPALRDDADWARAAAIQLVGLAQDAARPGPDRTNPGVAELAAVMTTLAGNELVDAAWDGDPSERAVMHAAGAVLAVAVGRGDEAAQEAVDALRPVLVRQLDDELAETAPLVDAFRGRLDG